MMSTKFPIVFKTIWLSFVTFLILILTTTSYSFSIFNQKNTQSLPTIVPDFVHYLSKHWAWEDKLQPIDVKNPLNYTNNWKSIPLIFSDQLAFMTDEYGIQQVGQTKSSIQEDEFSNFLANYGIMFGVGYVSHSNPPTKLTAIYYLLYPLLGIKQFNLTDNEFKWTKKADNDQLLDIKNSPTSNFFHYTIEFKASAEQVQRDMTSITIYNYKTPTNYEAASIQYANITQGEHTIFLPDSSSQHIATSMQMSGGVFNVLILTKNSNQPQSNDIQVFSTRTQIYAVRNMFAFDTKIINLGENIKSEVLLAVNSYALISTQNPFKINTSAMLYLENYTGEQTPDSLSTWAIIGIVVGSLALVVVVGGLIWLIYRHQNKTKQSSPTNFQ